MGSLVSDSALTVAPAYLERLIPDERAQITGTLVELVEAGCDLILTTGGTGPARRDVTPEATLDAGTREMPGFGEQMRAVSLKYVPTAILSRQTAGIRGRTLIVNLPGRPKAIRENLELMPDRMIPPDSRPQFAPFRVRRSRFPETGHPEAWILQSADFGAASVAAAGSINCR